ncbi:alpha/beta hydrolase [Cryptosporangium aurantiacum]|uniref:alpha/beta hydrolase n=1 Tax=Cryptosporangium aurantiacum TaxID=134849 RepID=UPI0009349E11|nr:dienelactone hydrolase family protein [Cryptosporangium aurantiacum]
MCTVAAPDAVPGTPAWTERELTNLQCSSQGSKDYNASPAYQKAFADLQAAWSGDEGRAVISGLVVGDPLRYPPVYWDDKRGQYEHVWIDIPNRGRISAEIFAPLADPSKRLKADRPPYPAVLIEHGGRGLKEPHWQDAEVLAEAGYVVLSIDVPGGAGGSISPTVAPAEPMALHAARHALDYLLSAPGKPTATGQVNPWHALVDERKVATLGQSLGAITTSYLAQVDPRVDTAVAYDSCEYRLDALGNTGPDPTSNTNTGGGCRTSPRPLLPEQLRTPRLAIQADYYNSNDVPRTQAPDPHHKDEYHRALVAKDIESMHVSLRAGQHNETAFARPGNTNQTRYGLAAHHYYTIAWLDYQLKGDRPRQKVDACRRLTAEVFDKSADVYEIGSGSFDPARAEKAGDVLAGNVPWTVGGLPVDDRLSFYFASGYHLGNGTVRNDDMRNDDGAANCAKLL